ncbi:MAG: tetratricopeptide repeat protein [Lentisphaerota bacterium]
MSFKAFIQIASVIVAVACIALIGYFALSYKNMADYMAEANLALNAEDYNRAAEILEAVISREVSNESAHRKLAAIYEQKGQPGTAVYYWRNVAKLNPLDRDVVLKIGENLLACRRYDEVVELLKPYLDSGKITPQEKICLCKAFLYNGQRKQAEPVIAEMLAADPDNIAWLLLKASMLASDGQHKAAADIFNRINSENAGIKSAVLIGLGNCARASGKMDKAEEYYLQALKVERNSVGPKFVLAGFYRDTGKNDKTAVLYWEILNRVPGSLEAIIPLAEIYAAKSDVPVLNRLIKEILVENKTAVASRNYIRAMITFIHNDFSETSKLLKRSTAYWRRPAYQWMLFKTSLPMKDYPSVSDAAAQLLRVKDSDKARKVIADAMGETASQAMLDEDYTYAEKLMNEIEQIDPVNRINARLLMLSKYRHGEYLEALRQAGTMLEFNPDSLEALEIQGRSLLQLNKPEKAVESFLKLIKIRPDSPVGLYLAAQAYRQAGNLVMAKEYIGKASKLSTEDNEIAEFAFMLCIEFKDYAGAKNITGNLLKSENRNTRALGWFLTGEMFNSKGDYAAAEENYKKAYELDPDTLRYCFLYSEMLIKTGKTAEAGRLLEYFYSTKSINPVVAFKMAYWEQKYGSLEKAVKIYEDLLHKMPYWNAVLVNLSEAYASLNDPRRADEYSEKAVFQSPEWAPVWICAGRRAMAGKDLLKAEEHFVHALAIESGNAEAKTLLEQVRQMIAKDQDNVITLIKRSEAYAAAKDSKQAMEFAEKALRAGPKFAPAWVCAGRRLMENKDFSRAGKYFTQALEFEPGNGVARSLLEQIGRGSAGELRSKAAELIKASESSAASKDFKHADEFAEKALAAAPEWPPVWIYAGRRAIGGKDYAKAGKYIAQALILEPGNADAQKLQEQIKQISAELLHTKAVELMKVSEAYAASEDFKHADEFAEKALAAAPEWPPVWIYAGRRAMSGRDYAKAEKYFVQALMAEPGNGEAKDLLSQVRRAISANPPKTTTDL